MTFSGKKVINAPENNEEQKKMVFFTNIEEGSFEETIKIPSEKFQIKSFKYKMDEQKRIYLYYFELVNNNIIINEYE